VIEPRLSRGTLRGRGEANRGEFSVRRPFLFPLDTTSAALLNEYQLENDDFEHGSRKMLLRRSDRCRA
jgi:hypothetical protein